MKYYEELETCFLCCIEGQLAHHHLIGGPYRKKSDALGLVVPLCPKCHEKVHNCRKSMLQLRRYAERTMLSAGWTREKWISEFGKDYLDDNYGEAVDDTRGSCAGAEHQR